MAHELLIPEVNEDLEYEVQTDKEHTKVVPCQGCGRGLVVTTFYAAYKGRCAECRGDSTIAAQEVAAPVPGKTDPARVANLAQCLINPQFSHALCPVHPDDEEHVMELKSIAHADHFGPGEWRMHKGDWTWVQKAPGESVLHQCLRCKATVAYSTAVQTQYQTQNEARKSSKTRDGWSEVLGAREESRD